MSDDTRPDGHLEHVVPLATPATPLPAAAEVVVVGGGIMGASIAFHLAEAGVTDVVVLEQGTLGSGSSAKPLGGVRATFSDANNVELGLRSLRAYETFADRFGIDIGLRQVGYLFLCRSEAELAAVEASVRLQNRLGCDSRMVTPARGLRDQPDAGAGPAARRVVLAAGRLRRTRPGGRGLREGRHPARGPVLRAHRGPRARHRRDRRPSASGPSGGASPPAR